MVDIGSAEEEDLGEESEPDGFRKLLRAVILACQGGCELSDVMLLRGVYVNSCPCVS